MSYSYPNFPQPETLQVTNALREARQYPVQYASPPAGAIQNFEPNKYAPSGNTPPPGTQVFGAGKTWFEMPQPLDIIHREIALHIDEPLLYRSAMSAPRRDTPDTRVFARSVTAPNNSATFINGKRGDVYGG